MTLTLTSRGRAKLAAAGIPVDAPLVDSSAVSKSPKKRGYSKAFTPHGDTGKRYLLDQIPAGLWTRVKAKAKRQGISIRALLLSLLEQWERE